MHSFSFPPRGVNLSRGEDGVQFCSGYRSVLLGLDSELSAPAVITKGFFLFSIYRHASSAESAAAVWGISGVHELILTTLWSILTTIMLFFFYFNTSHRAVGSIHRSSVHGGQWETMRARGGGWFALFHPTQGLTGSDELPQRRISIVLFIFTSDCPAYYVPEYIFFQ